MVDVTSILRLTDAASGTLLPVRVDEIAEVKEYPAGQCMVILLNGTVYQPAESTELVMKLWQEAVQ